MMLANLRATVSVRAVLLETDRPELLYGEDEFGTLHLCLLVTAERDGFHFVAIAVSRSRLKEVQEGAIDLRSAFAEPEQAVRFVGVAANERDLNRISFRAVAQEVSEAWLPDAGLKLTDFTGLPSADPLVVEAEERGAPVVICRLNPPEALGGRLRVNADRLAECLADFQSLVRQATKNVLRKITDRDRRASFGDNPSLLQVVGFSEGSFNVHLTATSESTDLFRSSPVADAMDIIDELVALSTLRPDDALIGLKKNQGQVLSAYETLLKFVVESETPFEYRWAEPTGRGSGGARINPAAAAAMITLLEHEETLKSDPFEIIGEFHAVNNAHRPFSWIVYDSEKKRMRRGVIHESAGDILKGVTIKTSTYRLVGESRLVKAVAGRQKPKLFLKAVDPVDSSTA